MRALLLDGSPAGDAATTMAADALEAELVAGGAEVTRWVLRELDLHACTGCFGCWTRTPGQCVIDDAAREVAAGIVASDTLAIATPVVFGTYGSVTKRMLDRSICIILPFFMLVDGEIHHQKRYDAYPSEYVLGTQASPDPEDEATFLRLTDRNAINMHCPSHGARVLAGAFTSQEARAAAASLLVRQEVAA